MTSVSARKALYSNSSYQVLRGGYDAPSITWYKNDDLQGVHSKMGYTQENFIRGFDLTVAEFLILRDWLVEFLNTTKIQPICGEKDLTTIPEVRLWETKRVGKYWSKYETSVDHDIVWPTYQKLKQHEILSTRWNNATLLHAPLAWKHYMAREFVKATIDFIVKTSKSHPMFPDWPAYPDFKFPWAQSDLAPAKKGALPKYKHIHIEVSDANGASALVAIVNLVPEESVPDIKSKKDLEPADIEWRLLVEQLEESNNVNFSEDTDIVTFMHPWAGNRVVSVHGDAKLQYALKVLRDYKSKDIQLAARRRS